MKNSRRNVAIIQRRLTQYRVPLFYALDEKLSERGIFLKLLVGDGTSSEEVKGDGGCLSWSIQISTSYWFGDRLCWQSTGDLLSNSDLVVVAQENKLLRNHLLLLSPRTFKLAFWGHGANFQSNKPTGLKERFKRWTTNRVDWWFAYTQVSADRVISSGYPDSRVTILNNSIDTDELFRQRKSVTSAETDALRRALGIESSPIGIYVGSLYADKRLDFLLESAVAIRSGVPDFHLLIVGDGPERKKVQDWCASYSWVRWVGAKVGRDKALYMSTAKILLNPGLVGLGILDSFVCQVPLITTDCGIHSPEIAYLENGVNGLMTVDNVQVYANACVRLLHDPDELDLLRSGCARSAREYTLESMVQRFADGIEHCLDAPRFDRRRQ